MSRPPLSFIAFLAFISLPAWGDTLSGEVVSIADGDTFTLLTAERDQVRIRLAEIDTPERGQPWGSRARQALADKVFRENVTVEVIDTDRYGRAVGRIYLDGRDINRELVQEGHAWVYRRYMRDPSFWMMNEPPEVREPACGGCPSRSVRNHGNGVAAAVAPHHRPQQGRRSPAARSAIVVRCPLATKRATSCASVV